MNFSNSNINFFLFFIGLVALSCVGCALASVLAGYDKSAIAFLFVPGAMVVGGIIVALKN